MRQHDLYRETIVYLCNSDVCQNNSGKEKLEIKTPGLQSLDTYFYYYYM